MTDALRQRAERLLADGSASTEALCQALFGGTGLAWDRLLRATLTGEPFVEDGGWWRLAAAEPAVGRVAFSIEATGQDPARHRIVQIAACRIEPNGASWHGLVNPDRLLPGWLAGRLGLDRAMADDAPSFATTYEAFRAFVGSATLVGYDTGWQIALIQAEARRAGLPPLANPVEDLLAGGAAWLAGKPRLTVLAARAGVPVGRRFRQASEARLIAAIAARLATAPAAESVDAIVEAARIAADTPGVYVFRDGEGLALYVGKAKRLRRRVLAYLNRPPAHDRDLAGLRAATRRVETIAAADDLDAHLIEARLLTDLAPPYNIQRRSSRAPRYLAIDRTTPFPRITRTHTGGPDRYGPYPSGVAALRVAAQAKAIFPLRTCTRKLGSTKPRPACALLAEGKCLGPCTGTVDARQYATVVRDAAAFLSGARSVAGRALRQQAVHAAAEGDIATRDGILDRLKGLTNDWAGSLLQAPFDPANVAVGIDDRWYVVVGGALRYAGPDDADAIAEALARPVESAMERDGVIVERWLASNHGQARLVPISGSAFGLVERTR